MNLRLPELNRVELAGRLTRDPELKYTTTGQPYCRLGVAQTRYWRDAQNQRQEETLFIDVTQWGKGAEFTAEHLRKGRAVLVEGSLTLNEWTDQTTGQRRQKIDVRAQRVQSMEWDDDAPPGAESRSAGRAASPASSPASRPAADEPPDDDDMPF